MFGLLGATSVLLFEPVTTVAAITDAGGPIDDLIWQALPVTVVFTFVTAVVITVLFSRRWSDFGAILLTTVVLVIFLGLNVSAIGLVEFTTGSTYLLAELFGLILAINVIFTATFIALERKSLASHSTLRWQLTRSAPRSTNSERGFAQDQSAQTRHIHGWAVSCSDCVGVPRNLGPGDTPRYIGSYTRVCSRLPPERTDLASGPIGR